MENKCENCALYQGEVIELWNKSRDGNQPEFKLVFSFTVPSCLKNLNVAPYLKTNCTDFADKSDEASIPIRQNAMETYSVGKAIKNRFQYFVENYSDEQFEAMFDENLTDR